MWTEKLLYYVRPLIRTHSAELAAVLLFRAYQCHFPAKIYIHTNSQQLVGSQKANFLSKIIVCERTNLIEFGKKNVIVYLVGERPMNTECFEKKKNMDSWGVRRLTYQSHRWPPSLFTFRQTFHVEWVRSSFSLNFVALNFFVLFSDFYLHMIYFVRHH